MLKTSESTKYIDTLLKRIELEYKAQNITLTMLAEKTQINPSTLSKIMKGKTKLNLEHLFAICNALKINPSNILEPQSESAQNFSKDLGLFQEHIFTQSGTLIRDPKHVAFNGYIAQKYYVYFYSTISSEISLISGVLKFELSESETYCKALFELNTGKKDQYGNDITKKYEGELLISLSMRCCYCILANSITGELCFLNFRHMYLFNQPLICRVAAALTTSSGESKYPTLHRALISYRKLCFTDDNDSDLDFIQGQIRLNSSSIIIEKEHFDNKYKEICEKKEISENVKKLIETIQMNNYISDCYILDEARIRCENFSDSEKIKAINILRDLSISPKYNKVSPKTDEFFFKYLSEISPSDQM